MRKLYILICLFSGFLFMHLYGAFEDRCNYLICPSISVYGFHPVDYFSKNQSVLFATGSQLYSISECTVARGGFLISLPIMHIGIDAGFFGSDLYNENELGVSFLAGKQYLFGSKLKIMRIGIKNYGSRFYGGNDLLFVAQSAPFYSHSIYRNVISYGYKFKEERPTSSFSSLLKFYPDTWLSFNIKINYSELTGTHFEIGNGFLLSNILSIGGGFNFQTRSISSDLILTIPFSDLSYGVSVHPELGLTHTVGIVYSLQKKAPMPSDTL